MTHPPRDTLCALSAPLVLVGAGKMGSALLEGWIQLGLDPRHVVVLDPQPGDTVAAYGPRGLRLNPPTASVGPPPAIVVPVKPQVAPAVVPGLTPLLGPATVAISIMA